MTGARFDWKSGVVRVAVMGQVLNDFGIRINKQNRVSVTHMPSGFGCGVFDDEITAKKYVENIVFHPDWKDLRVDADGTAHVPGGLASYCSNLIHKMTAERTIV